MKRGYVEVILTKWRVEMIETLRGRFEVFTKGTGKPLCVTHLYSEFNESGDYFAEMFTDHYQVFLINLKDAGNSDKPKEAFELSMIDAVLDLEAIRKAKNLSSWIFAGHSTGGMLGLVYGIHFSSSLEAIITVGAAAREYSSSSERCIYNEKHPHYSRMQALMDVLKDTTLSSEDRKAYTKERTQLSLYHPAKYDDFFSKPISKRIVASRLNFFSREVLIYDVTRQLPSIQVKTYILCGRHDVQCPIEFSLELKELIPKATIFIFEESNHYPFLEEKQAFEKAIDYIFQGHSFPPPSLLMSAND